MTSELDLDDPLVRQMADDNHVPSERWDLGGDMVVLCERCGQAWPCATRQALRHRSDLARWED